MERVYICIDLKSFYASVECVERGLDPLKTNLAVADATRTEKTICLAISPSLKQYGIGGRARLFELLQLVKEVNRKRKEENKNKRFTGKSIDDDELKRDKTKELDLIIAPPRMSHYINFSAKIYNIYLRHIASEDIFVYSIDEVFADITKYLKYNHTTPKEFVTTILKEVVKETGITATAGIGSNLFLAKVAMDVVAKHAKADEYGVRIARLDEKSFKEKLWDYRPITDIWRIGKGIASRLEQNHIYTLGDIARCSIENEELLYKLFGVNAELLIDHAWGVEPCTIESIKSYKPLAKSISTGQVLPCPYSYQKAKLIIREMSELLALNLAEKHLVTDQLVLTIGYDISNVTENYHGEIKVDFYGRKIPKHAHGNIHLEEKTSSSRKIMDAVTKLFEKIIDPDLLVKRINISATGLISVEKEKMILKYEQLDIFTNPDTLQIEEKARKKEEREESSLQQVVLNIKEKYGKNAILRGMNLESGSTTIERNRQIGGHHE